MNSGTGPDTRLWTDQDDDAFARECREWELAGVVARAQKARRLESERAAARQAAEDRVAAAAEHRRRVAVWSCMGVGVLLLWLGVGGSVVHAFTNHAG